MKFALFVGFTIFCSLWTIGSFLQCSFCSSEDSYEDCQNKLKVGNCTDNSRVCFQAEVKYSNGSNMKNEEFSKGCLDKVDCEDYEKGQFGYCVNLKGQGYTVDCRGKCCDGNDCNKINLLDNGSLLQCWQCESEVSYEECQKNQKLVNCTGSTPACYQAEIKYEKDSDKKQAFSKGCLDKVHCEDYEKGEIGECVTLKGQGYTVDCRGKCCHEDECNKGDLVDSKGSAFIISVIVLLSALLLTLVNIN